MTNHRKRPRDPSQLAKMIVDIAAGEIDESNPPQENKSMSAAEMGRKGGKARAAKMTDQQRIDAARSAAKKRWEKD